MARSPLFDLYDPQGLLDQQFTFGLPGEEGDEFGVLPVRRRRPQIADLLPEEEKQGMLGKLAAMGSSGLAGLGWILDTPGAMVRGLLSEGPGKALSALWDTSEERVTGRELLRQYGMIGQEDTWGNFAGSVAAEALLDPLTYASFGLNQVLGAPAKTVVGQAAQKANLLQDFDVYARNTLGMGRRQGMREATARGLLDNMAPEAASVARERFARELGNLSGNALEEALDAPLARMNRVGVPGLSSGATDLFGKTVGDATAKWADEFGDTLMKSDYTGPVLRRLNAAVGDADVLGMTEYQQQLDAKELSALRRRRRAQDVRPWGELQMDADAALRAKGSSLGDSRVAEAIRIAAERPDLVPSDLADLIDLPEVQRIIGKWEGVRDYAPVAAQQRGLPLEEFQSRAGTGFVPRQQTEFDVSEFPAWPEGALPPDKLKKQYSRGNRRVNFNDNYGRSRRIDLDVMGGTDTLNRMSRDDELQEALRGAKNEDVRNLLEDWWSRSGTPVRSSEMPTDFWPESALMDRAGFADDTAGMVARGDGSVVATKAAGPKDGLFGWLDELDDEGEFIHRAPELPASHPLARQASELAEQLRRAEAGGELHRVGELKRQLDSVKAQIPTVQREAYRDTLYTGLADFVRTMDPQHARRGVPVFGQNTFNEMVRYATGRGRVETDADFMLKLLKREAAEIGADQVVGGVNYAAEEALKKLGLTGETATDVLEKTIGRPLDQVSFSKKFVDDWSRVIDPGRLPEELSAPMQLADDFLKSFKTLALAWPSRYARDAYSGAFAAAMKNSFNPFDWYAGTQMRKGNYKPLTEGMLGGLIPPRLARAPEYADLLKTDPEAAVRKFLLDAGQQGLGTSTFTDELVDGAGSSQLKELFPGAARPTWSDIGRRVYNPDRTWGDALRDFNPLATRTGSGNRNPLLELADRAAETTDAGNRFGTYLNQIRQGAAPEEAARIANLTQVNYAPDAFTDFERNVLKRVIPFYSYSRGILPLIGDELLERPAGLMGQSTRAITRASEPSEESFTPEYLRQSVAIPLPEGLPLVSLQPGSGLKRYLTNIDLPFESVINLVTPGLGNTTTEAVGNTLRKSALNLLGQTNPLIKGPLELLTNRQFYSGRQLSDLYSVLEQSLGAPGRLAEQVLVNSPGGSRLVGAYRQLTDDRLEPTEKYSKFLVNALTGLKFQDVDQERTKRLAARDMLNQLLETTPGVRTYENITVPEDVLRAMEPEQQRMYLLYKVIQAEAAKRARDKKRAEQTALDPLELLGAVQQF